MDQIVYLDNAATTKIDPEVLYAMMPYLREEYGNASASYALGRRAREAVDKAREQVASLINASPEEIFFTSGATEANNWVTSKAHKCIMSEIEHPSILRAFDTPIGKKQKKDMVIPIWTLMNGTVDIGFLEDAANQIKKEKAYRPLITVMYANNEIGTIQPIKRISEIAWDLEIPFHTDATQAFGHIPIDVDVLDICYMSASAHKIYGPKGIGMLYCRDGYPPPSFMRGGHQERGFRAGTENVAGIVGFGKAAELSKERMDGEIPALCELRDYFITAVMDEIRDVRLNGDPIRRLPNNANLTFRGVDAETLLLLLDEAGICASAGSACTTGERKPSHVLKAIGLTDEQALSTARFTLGRETTYKHIDYTVDVLKKSVEYLREVGKNVNRE